ncbi:MAG: hypothetical protein JXX14_01955 [Deltaproteobacteria bacterium]|nr:hypothetical protein [Deltaproteobacteria bacterium]
MRFKFIIYICIISMLSLPCVSGAAQENAGLKPLPPLPPPPPPPPPAQQLESPPITDSHGDLNTVNVPPPVFSNTVSEESLKGASPSAVGFAIAVAGDFGLGLHESADVRNSFDAAGVIGLESQLRFIQLTKLRFGVNLGVAHFAHTTSKGTSAIKVSSRMNRLTSLASVELYKSAFFFNGQAGAGFMILGVESTLVQNGVAHTSSNTGFDPGFMAAMAVGLEFGHHFFKWKREARLAFHSDWMRHDERDEIVFAIQISIGLYSSFLK